MSGLKSLIFLAALIIGSSCKTPNKPPADSKNGCVVMFDQNGSFIYGFELNQQEQKPKEEAVTVIAPKRKLNDAEIMLTILCLCQLVLYTVALTFIPGVMMKAADDILDSLENEIAASKQNSEIDSTEPSLSVQPSESKI